MTNLRENTDIKKLPQPIQTRLFDFIEKEIPRVRFFKPDGKPKKEWKVFYGDTWNAARYAARVAARDAARVAEWNAARVAARVAARDVAGVAAWDAAWDAARNAALVAARDAAWDAAWITARNAALVAARDAAWDAAWDAARDAPLFSDYIITSDLTFKDQEKHLAYAKARWEVWQKGYGLLCDIDGVLYVYVIGKAEGREAETEVLV